MVGWDHGGWLLGGDAGWGWMMIGWLWMILIMLAPILLVLSLVKYLFGGSKPSAQQPETPRTALQMLDETYAKGTISREEYLQKRDDLKKP